MECYIVVVACGRLNDDDVLVLPLDVTDIASHSSATDTILKTFGQVLLLFPSSNCILLIVNIINSFAAR